MTFCQIRLITAVAGVHGCHKDKIRWKAIISADARHTYLLVLQRLTQDFQRTLFKLCSFI